MTKKYTPEILKEFDIPKDYLDEIDQVIQEIGSDNFVIIEDQMVIKGKNMIPATQWKVSSISAMKELFEQSLARSEKIYLYQIRRNEIPVGDKHFVEYVLLYGED